MQKTESKLVIYTESPELYQLLPILIGSATNQNNYTIKKTQAMPYVNVSEPIIIQFEQETMKWNNY